MSETKLMMVSLTRDIASPPLGLASIATYLRQEGISCETRIADVNFGNPIREALAFRPDLVGISAFSVQVPDAVRVARKVRDQLQIPVILGGVHISTLPESLPPEFDLGVKGEAEQTVVEVIGAFQKHGHLGPDAVQGIPGLVYRENGELVHTPAPALIQPLDRIPIPDRSFVHPGYFEPVALPPLGGKKVRTTASLTGRGCPYRCTFCSTTAFWGNKVRWHTIDRVVEEVRHLVEEYGIEHLMIWDDLFAINRKRVVELTEALREAGLLGKVKFSCQMRANLMDEEMAQILWDLGIVAICFGLESGSEKTLKYLKNSVTVAQNRTAIELAKAKGFYATGGLIFGSPGETLEDMEDTLEFMDHMRSAGVDNTWCFSATPFPGTPMWDEGLAKGVLANDMDFGELNLYRPIPLLLDESVSLDAYRKLMRRAHRKMRAIRAPLKWLRLKLLLTDPANTVRSYIIQHLVYRDWLGPRMMRRLMQSLRPSR
jgi:radical SAM superfamily enzyme YgiQ (UPF0313 family)